jgi:putative ribosome biogenesis GTPase RsgA
MLVGATGGGKSTIINILTSALTAISATGEKE